MKNNAKNRALIARIELASLSFEDMKDALIYEFTERYQREPDLFDRLVKELKPIEMIDDKKTYTCAGCEPEYEHPDIDYCDDCEAPK